MGEKSQRFFGARASENSLMHADDTVAPDFSGWATKANLKCSDGRTIMTDAFKHQDKEIVPLVWQHGQDEISNVLGHMVLENRDEGVYAYGYFNDSDNAEHAKKVLEHGDIKFLSIYANGLVEKSKSVIHGIIREISLVLAGANPGAKIDHVQLQHGDGEMVELEDEAVIHTGLELVHGDGAAATAEDGPTVQDVYDSMSQEQKDVTNFMVGQALEEAGTTAAHAGTTPNTEGRRMSRNVFEQQNENKDDKKDKHVLSHDAVKGIVENAVRTGSLKEAVEVYALKHGINDIDVLFPDARTVGDPQWDSRRVEWVAGVLSGTKHSPFSRVKTIIADITHDEARAKGYIKGNMKKEEWFGLTKRTTTPATIYKKQKLDRDDIIDITDLDVVAWMKGEMRLMLDEELARAILIGDGRAVDDEDKIKDPIGATDGAGIRSILNDDDLYTMTVNIASTLTPTQIVDNMLTEMTWYKGSGSPTLYTTLGFLTRLLLARDTQGRRFYRTPSDLAGELGVSSIVTVEVMEDEPTVAAILVNLSDYTIGADKGGEVSMFDDFDIDYNQFKYLIETRLSGGLTKIRSAIVYKLSAGGVTRVVPVAPTFVPSTGVLTPATTTGVTYKRADTNATIVTGSPITLTPGQDLTVIAVPASASYDFADNEHDEWSFERPAS